LHLYFRSAMAAFIGRQAELDRLIALTAKRTASFVVVRGRRRIGKSRLIQEFAKGFEHAYTFVGLPPERNTTSAHQLEEFCRQLARQFRTAPAQYQDWSDALWALGERVQTGKTLLFFDEISWMGSRDPNFLGKIKNAWDLHFKQNDQLIFVVCGSASAWIEQNLLSNTGFAGRISVTLTMEELPLPDCSRFWPEDVSAYEKFKLLSVTGGIPKYLEEIDPRFSAEDNIKRLCFSAGGFLVDEFRQIFSDILMRDSDTYKKILQVLCAGRQDMEEIKDNVGSGNGRVSEYLHELELAGFVARDYTWDLHSGKGSTLSRFRLKDNYVRFFLKYVEERLDQINQDGFEPKSMLALPEWHTIMGLQFENLVLSNRRELHRLLKIAPDEIVNSNPYFRRKTGGQPGCQIDYLIQTRFDTLYLCEVKFSRNAIGASVIPEVQSKVAAMNRPRGMSCRPVLIHVNGVSSDLIESRYFAHIVDLGRLLA
jgi:uncharacterized protein